MMGMLEDRLQAPLKVDHVDLFFIHALGDHHSADEADRDAQEPGAQGSHRGDQEVGQGQVRRLLDPPQEPGPDHRVAAAEGGFVDAIMVQYTPWMMKDTPLNKALDAAHKAGIGLISMKQIAGPDPAAFLAEVPKHAPELIEKGLKPFQAMLHSIWTDERISTCCVSMRTTWTKSARTPRRLVSLSR